MGQAAQAVLVAARLVDCEAALILLRVVHRDVGALHERVGIVGVLGIDGDAEAGVHVDRDIAEDERRVERRCRCAPRRPRHRAHRWP
jgi:hypothetical protein